MAKSWDLTPNRNLAIASGLAQGLQSGFNAFQTAQARAEDRELKRMQIQGDAELRRLQMEKLRQEMAPIEFDLRTWNAMDQGVSAGVIPEKMRDKKAEEIFQKADTPQKLQFLTQAIDRKKAEDLRKMAPLDLSQAFGGGMSDVMQVPEVPEAQASSGQEAPQEQSSQPIRFKNAKEAEFYKDLYKAKYGAQAQFAGIQQRDDASARTYESTMAGIAGKLAASEDANETKRLIQEMKDLTARFNTTANNQNRVQVQGLRNEGGLNNQRMRNRGLFDATDMRNKGALAVEEARGKNRLDVAGLNAQSREKVAAKRGAGSKGAPSNPEQKMMLDLIKQGEKALSDANKPSSGLNMELPQEKAQRIQNANAHLQRLYSQYETKYGANLRGGAAEGKAPESKAGPAQPKAPAVVPQGNARPKFSRGPGVSAQIAKLKDGTEFEVDGQVFVLQGGQAVPR